MSGFITFVSILFNLIVGNKIITYICDDMPTIFILFGFQFMFYSNEHLPIHVHVKKGGACAKFMIDPVLLVENSGMKPAELKLIESIIVENVEVIAGHWNRYFNKRK